MLVTVTNGEFHILKYSIGSEVHGGIAITGNYVTLIPHNHEDVMHFTGELFYNFRG